MSNSSVVDELTFDADSGALVYKEVRYLLIRPETVIAFQKAAEARLGVEIAGDVLYDGGFAGGRLSGQRYRTVLGLSAAEGVAFMCRMGGQIGWGRFDLVELDEQAHRLRVDVHASPFASAYGPGSAGGVCHLIRGVLGGLASGTFAVEVRAVETACVSLGDSVCRFEVRGQE